jgi:hypothetical protein
MKRRLAILFVFILALLAAPSLFAAFCEDCPDGINCLPMDGGARFCVFNPDGSCYGIGWCPQASASLRAEYRVAAVRVLEPCKTLPEAQPKRQTVLTAAK